MADAEKWVQLWLVKPLRVISLYLLFVFVGGALLAPWLYWGVDAVGAHSAMMAKLANNPFPRFMNRCWIFLAVVGLWPFLRALGIRSWRDVGLVRPQGHWHRLGWGVTAGFFSLAVAAVVAVLAGVRHWYFGQSNTGLAEDFLTAVLAAAVAGPLEELLFRGALFGALRQQFRWPMALLLSSALFGLVHFLQKVEAPETIEWTSGLALLPRMLRGFGEWKELVPGFFNLALAAMILGLAYQRTGNLWFSMGLHGGWIFWLKFYRGITRGEENVSSALWGSSKLIDGWASGIVLALTLVLVWKCLPEPQNTHEPHPPSGPEKLA